LAALPAAEGAQVLAKVYEVVLDFLQGSGITLYAGMVGSTTAPYVSRLVDTEASRYVAVRHEQVAAAIVDASARLTGRPGCVLIHGASGALAASLGIATAAKDNTPMLVLNATQERIAMEGGFWQTADVLQPLAALAKYQIRVERPDQALTAVARALHEAVAGKPGVAQVDLPIDVSTAEYDGPPVAAMLRLAAPLLRPCPDPEVLSELRRLLAAAERPVILIGGGAAYSGAGPALVELAELLHAPVVSTQTSRGVVDERHPLSLGPSGILGYEPIGAAIREADLVLAIGSRLSDMQTVRGTLLPNGAPIVQIDIDAATIGRSAPVAFGIVADARAFCDAMVALLRDEPLEVPASRRRWAARLSQDADRWFADWLSGARDTGKVQPQEVVAAFRDHLPADVIMTHGAGDHGFYGPMVKVGGGGTHIMSATLGAMGCSLGHAIGAKLQQPTRTVIACSGDGEFLFNVGDVETMVREKAAVVVVVFNNFRLGSQRPRVAAYGKVQGTDHGNPDYARLAELFGARGYRVDKPGAFAAALRDAIASGEPAIIDVIVDPEARPPRIAMSREAK